MTLEDKQKIAIAACILIQALKDCDDPDYVDEVVSCVSDGEIYPAIDPFFFAKADQTGD